MHVSLWIITLELDCHTFLNYGSELNPLDGFKRRQTEKEFYWFVENGLHLFI
jgi:hypothetical protein